MNNLEIYLKELFNGAKCTKRYCAEHKHFGNLYFYQTLENEKILSLYFNFKISYCSCSLTKQFICILCGNKLQNQTYYKKHLEKCSISLEDVLKTNKIELKNKSPNNQDFINLIINEFKIENINILNTEDEKELKKKKVSNNEKEEEITLEIDYNLNDDINLSYFETNSNEEKYDFDLLFLKSNMFDMIKNTVIENKQENEKIETSEEVELDHEIIQIEKEEEREINIEYENFKNEFLNKEFSKEYYY
jgi:hypothetical protein